MGLIIRNIHGKDFLVYLKEKKQIYLGPKGEYEKGKIDSISEAKDHNDLKIDKTLEKYVEDAIELSLYMPEPERKEYLSKRTAELLAMIRRLEEELRKTKIAPPPTVGPSNMPLAVVPNRPSRISPSHRGPNLKNVKKRIDENKKQKKKKKKKA